MSPLIIKITQHRVRDRSEDIQHIQLFGVDKALVNLENKES